jgi:methyl coenzyme M reductase subunit C
MPLDETISVGQAGHITDHQLLAVRYNSGTNVLVIAVSDETTAITTGVAKVTFRMPYALSLTAVRASLNTASSSGIPTVDINESGTTILSTKLTIDASEKTSTTAAVPAVISDAALADDAEITIDIDVAGTGAKGLKVVMIGTT